MVAAVLGAVVVTGCTGGTDEAADARGERGSTGAETSTTANGGPGTVGDGVEVPAGGYPVLTHTETLVDRTRPTPDLPETGVPAADERVVETTFAYPDAPGPFPLVVFSHGHNGHPRKFTELLQAWAAAGLVVAAPTFPLSNDEVPGAASPFDLPEQSGDVSFVITEALAANEAADGPLVGRVDPERIGIGGLSLGGATTYQAAFDDCCRDDRVDAVAVFDALRPDLAGLRLDAGVPLLVIHADRDPVAPVAPAEEAFAAAAPPKHLIVLHEVMHAQAYEDDPDPADELVRGATTAFWRHYLADDPDAAAAFTAAARVDGLSTVTEQPR